MNKPLRTIRLYGKLGAMFGRVHRLAVGSAAEAVRALRVLKPGFEQYLINCGQEVRYAVFYGKTNVTEEMLAAPCGDEDIRIAPITAGAKNGLFATVLGLVLVVVGVFLWQPWLIALGVGVMAAGIAQMLVPNMGGEGGDRPENLPSYSFNGPVNAQAQGNPIPLLYGELIVGSVVLSAGISAEDMVIAPLPGAGSGTGTGPGWGPGGGNSITDFAIQ